MLLVVVGQVLRGTGFEARGLGLATMLSRSNGRSIIDASSVLCHPKFRDGAIQHLRPPYAV